MQSTPTPTNLPSLTPFPHDHHHYHHQPHPTPPFHTPASPFSFLNLSSDLDLDLDLSKTFSNVNNSNDNNWTSSFNSTPAWIQAEAPTWPAYLPIYVTILNVMVFFTGTVGNVLVIVVVVLVREMRTPMNWYLVNLSMADLLVLLICQPAALVEFYARDRWFLGAVLCKMVPFLEHAVLHASTLIILSITVERYYAICRPLRKLAMCHKPRPLRVLPCVWSTAVLTSIPFIVMTSLDDTFFYDGTPCKVCATSVVETWHYIYILTMSLCFFALPLLLLLCLYCRIIRALRTSGCALRVGQVRDVNLLSSHRSRKQVIKMLVGIVLLFFVSLLPVRCVILWQVFSTDVQIRGLGPENYYNIMWISRLLMYTNSAGNPIIYSLISSNFQQAFWRLLTGGRHAPINVTSRGSESSRRGSVSRALMSTTPGSSVRLVNLDSPSFNGHHHHHHLHHHHGRGRGSGSGVSNSGSGCMTSLTCTSAAPDSATSSPLVKKGVMFSLPHKDRTCSTIL